MSHVMITKTVFGIHVTIKVSSRGGEVLSWNQARTVQEVRDAGCILLLSLGSSGRLTYKGDQKKVPQQF